MKNLFLLMFSTLALCLFGQVPQISVEDPVKAEIEITRGDASAAIEQNGNGGELRLQHATAQDCTLILLRTFGDSFINGGKLGIGTTSPNAYLDFDLPDNSGTAIRITNDASQSAINVLNYGGVGITGATEGTYEAGVRGECFDDCTHGYGVYGYTDNLNGAGGYFTGSVAIELGSNSSQWGDGNDNSVIRTEALEPNGDLHLVSNDEIVLELDDNDGSSNSSFKILDGDNSELFEVDEGGVVKVKGVMVHGSDRNRKENFSDVNASEILNQIVRVPIQKWSFKGKNTTHLGPMAQDFFQAFGLGESDTMIATVDADGVALAAIQALYHQNQEQQDDIRKLREEIEMLKSILKK